jgi:hypothetical protein
MTISLRILLRMRNVSNKNCRKNKNIFCSWTFSENRAVYDIMSKNLVELERPQMTIWRRVACWISKATLTQAHASAHLPTSIPTLAGTHMQVPTHTHTEICKTYCFSMATVVSWTYFNVIRILHVLLGFILEGIFLSNSRELIPGAEQNVTSDSHVSTSACLPVVLVCTANVYL